MQDHSVLYRTLVEFLQLQNDLQHYMQNQNYNIPALHSFVFCQEVSNKIKVDIHWSLWKSQVKISSIQFLKLVSDDVSDDADDPIRYT